MIFHLDTWYENQDGHGNSLNCLKFELKTASNSFRDKIRSAILAAAGPEPEAVEQKPSVMGFTVED